MSYELAWRYSPREDWCPPGHSLAIQHGLWIPTTSYFVVRVGAMSALIDLMVERNMLSFGDAPPEPVPESFGITDPPYPGSTDFSQNPDPSLEAFEDAWWLTRQMRLPERGIALYKLCSNDHWWVRPDEINEALECAARWPSGENFLWNDWLAYVRGAATHGGFTVL